MRKKTTDRVNMYVDRDLWVTLKVLSIKNSKNGKSEPVSTTLNKVLRKALGDEIKKAYNYAGIDEEKNQPEEDTRVHLTQKGVDVAKNVEEGSSPNEETDTPGDAVDSACDDNGNRPFGKEDGDDPADEPGPGMDAQGEGSDAEKKEDCVAGMSGCIHCGWRHPEGKKVSGCPVCHRSFVS